MEDKITELSSPSGGSHRRMHISHQDSTQTGTTSPPFFPAPQTSTSTAKHLTRRPHHSGGSKLSGIWRPPFERTWSVPEQYATTSTSSPVSKGSSRSSIEQVISREEAALLAGRKHVGGQQVVIEAPVYSLLKMPSLDRGSKDHINKNMFAALKEDVKYLDDPLVDLSFSPPPNAVRPTQPPSYFQIHPEFGKGAFHPPTAVVGNIYSNPSHFSSQQKFQSHAGTPVEVKLSSCGSPVQFCPLNSSNQVGGSVGGIGARNIRHRIADLTHKQAPCCNTQPNSPTSSRQKSLFGRIRRFPSLKLQRHTPVTSSGTMNRGASIQQPLLLKNNNLQQARKIKHRSTPTLPEGVIGPTITVTTHSEDELNRNQGLSHERVKPTFAFNSVVHLGDDASLYGTPKEQTSPPPGGASNGGDHFKFNNNTASNNNVNNTTSTSNYLRDQIISFFQPSDNKLAMKLFGNKNALMKEKMRQKAAGNWVIHPCSNFRFYWDLFMLVLLIANLIILPVAISFFNDDLSTKWIVFNGLSDTVFLLDLIINFRTGIIADNFADDIILEPREIAKHYLKTWFFLDLISSIPLDYIILLFSPDANITQLIHAGRALRIVRLVKLLSLLRLLRLSRLVRYVSQWEEDIGQFLTVASKFMRIVNLVCLILLLGHWNGCLQWLVPMIQEFPRDSWAALEELQGAHWTEQYTWALFKALSHMLCIGYGRYPPQSTTDVWLTTVSMLTGATCYALFVGHSTTLIQSFDTSRRLYREKFKQVEEYMIYRKLPRKLRQKITDYYEHRYQGKMFDEQSILAEVNECLREEIINYNCRALVASVPFFTHADPNFVSDIVTNLRHEMFQPGDYIIREGSVGTKVYFIQEGIVDIITQNGEVATSLSDGSYFGEICLLAKTKRTASVRAEAYCNLFSLTVEHFDAVLERYPLMRRTMESVAAERLNKIGKDPCILSNRDDLEADISMVNELIMRATPLPSSGSDDSDGNGGHLTDDDRKPQKKRKKRDDQGSGGGSKDHKEKDTLTVKLATILRRSRSNINMRQASKDEK